MAMKRKDVDDGEDGPSKRPCQGAIDEHVETQPGHTFDRPYISPYAPVPALNPWYEVYIDNRRHWICTYQGCEYRCNRLQKMHNHLRVHTGERPFACPHEGCDKDFTRKDKLNWHIKYGHGQEEAPRKHVCTFEDCTRSFQTKQHLAVHMESHTNKFHCTGFPPCEEFFRKQKTLDAHIAKAHLNSAHPYPCTYVDEETGERCTKSYKSEKAMRKHLSNFHQKDEAVHFCSLCPAPGSGFDVVETENGPLSLAKEPLAFDSYQELSNHNREHHPPICSLCSRQFASESNLRAHVDTVHSKPENQQLFTCPYPECDQRTFTFNSNLKAHIRNVHEKLMRFVCNDTAFADSKKDDLKAWAGRDACGKAFTAKSTLEQHVRRMHLTGKNRRDMRKERKQAKPAPSALRLLTGHGFDGGREIPCLEKDCDARFFQDRDLRRHLRAVHELDEAEITERILERNALEGGEFWVRHGEDLLFESADTSIAPTPDYQGSMVPENYGGFNFGYHDPALETPFGEMKLASLAEEDEAGLDMEMGFDALQAWNTENGLPGL